LSIEFLRSRLDDHLSYDDAPTPKVIDAMARFSLNSGFFLFAVAERMGLAVTDLSCLLVVMLEGPAPAGWLAGRSGLSTGAITGIVDRLERGGWVGREDDPSDRRRVVIRLVEERRRALNSLLEPLDAVATDLCGTPGSATQPSMMVSLRNATATLATQTQRIHHGGTSPLESGPAVGSRTIQLETWTGELIVRSADLGPELVRVAPDGGLATNVRGTKLTVGTAARPHRRGRRSEEVQVDRNTVWMIELNGGANRMRLDLADIRLGGLTIGGGANRLQLVLPAPVGQIALRVAGGANKVSIERPDGTAVNVRITGGSSDVQVDGIRHRTGWQSSTALGATADRYDIELSGGASQLALG
jgi:DNA-binding MarR family transcriptional regulator